ncbi:RNA polymerase sigma-70 factor [Proteiniphilum saccharofermentans]|uniref:RNA polymerase sigma-70 factor n=1 Tax=Proteiniphilum saccharofermentans TaxID=1642647 RepID=A0A1R3SYV5_9BACT|nr:RNA polymerase sigma-70 factor [Proteiniphilum saccharofermentans]SCD19059.1 RNA polymerase sigma-70 factor [Proteiniphilum saccharofermentans]
MRVLEKRFSGYFCTYYRQLCLYALHFMGNAEEAEDVVQETFVSLWNKREQIESIRSVKSYLYTAVRNNCLTRIRDAKPTTSLDILPDEQFAEEDQMKRAEMEARIWKMIDELPERRREIFLMAKRDGISYKEIAEQTGLSVKTVENHVFRAMQSLRNKDFNAYLFFFA